MKKLFLCLALLAGTTLAMAQQKLSGMVTDASGNPLPGANLYSEVLHKGTSADSNGRFSITIPKGRFVFIASMVGYESKRVSLSADRPTPLIRLEESDSELSEVIVTGVTQSVDQRRAPISAAVIKAGDMATQASSNIVNAIANIPGVNALKTGPAISKPVIRGLGYNRVVTLYNGVRQEEQQWGAEHGIQLDQLGIQRTEIIKGPASLLYGSDALGGVINFITEEALQSPTVKGFFQSQYQSNNHMQEYGLHNAGALDALFWSINLDRKKAGNYRNGTDGVVYNSGFENMDFSGSLGSRYNWGSTHFFFSSFNQKIGIIEGERDATGAFTKPTAVGGQIVSRPVSKQALKGYDIALPYQHLNHYRAQLEQNLFLGTDKLQLDLAYQQNRRREFEAPEVGDPVDPAAQGDAPSLHLLLRTYNYGARYQLGHIHDWKITLGTNGMYQTNENQGTEFLIPDYGLFDLGGYLYASRTLHDKWNLAGGVRYDLRRVNSKALQLDEPAQAGIQPGFTAFEKQFSNLSGSLGLSYLLNDYLTLKVNLARGFRAPNLQELAANGIHEGTDRYEVGNRNLKPETDTEFDSGLIWNKDGVTLDLSGFYNRIAHYIYIQKDPQNRTVNRAQLFAYQQKDATLWGAEAGFNVHPKSLHWLHWHNSFSFVNARFQHYEQQAGKYLPFIPAPKLHTDLKATFKLNSPFKSIFVSLGLTHMFKQDRVYTLYDTESATPAYTLFGASAGCTFGDRDGKQWARLYVIADNLFDKSYQDHLSRLKYIGENPANGQRGLYQMGRNISFKLIIPFQFD